MIRVANVIEEGRVGGPQIRMVRVARAMSSEAKTVVVMPGENSDAFQQLCVENDVQYRVLPLTRMARDWKAFVRYLVFSGYEILRLARFFRREGINLVHVSGGSWQYKGVLAARLAGIPAVWHLNDTSMPTFIKWAFYVLSPLVSGFIFASYRSREYYSATLGQRPHAVVPSTVDSALFDPSRWREAESHVISEFDGTPVVSVVANVNPIKGLETFIRAAAACYERRNDIQFVVVGPVYDNQRAYYERLTALAEKLGLSEALHWVGGQSDVRPFLARTNVYVCSSLAESSPVSVWEAMAMACPVVSTDVGDIPVHIENEENGYIVPVNDYENMAKRIISLLNSPDLAADMGNKARAVVEANFSPAAVAGGTEEIYKRVLEYHRKGSK